MKDRMGVKEKILFGRGKSNTLFLPIKQRAIIELCDSQGNLKHREETHNGVTNKGLDLIVNKMSQTTLTVPYPLGMELGDSSTAFSPTDADLIGTPISGSWTTFESGYPLDDIANNRVEWQGYWAAGTATSATINEVVVKSGDATTDAVSRVVFTTINKGVDDTLRITIRWTFAGTGNGI